MAKKRDHNDRRKSRESGDHYIKPPQLIWPRAGLRADQYSDGELYAISLHPMVCGLGAHPRVCSDEDFVNNVLSNMEAYGVAVVVSDMLAIMRSTAHFWDPYVTAFQPDAALADFANYRTRAYPTPKTDLKLPMPNVDVTGKKWTAAIVMGVSLNPVMTGIGRYAALIDTPTFIRSFQRAASEFGLAQTLVNVLFMLRYSFGFPGGDEGHVPYGYEVVNPE